MTNFVKYNRTHYIKAISSLSSKAVEIQCWRIKYFTKFFESFFDPRQYSP